MLSTVTRPRRPSGHHRQKIVLSLNASRAKFKLIRDVLQDMGRMVAWAQLRSSGRQGADTADALIAFGADRKAWQGALLNATRQCAKQTAKDWKTYAKAYDQGAFKV